jgi:hypothetical protein
MKRATDRYRARLEFGTGRFAWCQIEQVPGEQSIGRKPVLKVAAACRGGR